MLKIKPGDLCTHHVYTLNGLPDSFNIYTGDMEQEDLLESEKRYHLYAEDIFLCLNCGEDKNGIKFYDILTSSGIVGRIHCDKMYDDLFAVVHKG